VKYSARDLSIGGLFCALGIALPVLFHMVGLGSAFLPMHLPVLICGMLVSPTVALAVGALTPILSSVLTGMPPVVPMVPIMVVELGVLALVASLMSRKMRTHVILVAITSMLMARAAVAAELTVIAPWIGIKAAPVAYVVGAVLQGLPGIALQLLVAPSFIAALRKLGART